VRVESNRTMFPSLKPLCFLPFNAAHVAHYVAQ